MKTFNLKYSKKCLFLIMLMGSVLSCFSQSHNGWTTKEENYYKTLKSFCNYIESIPDYSKNADSLTRYIYFDYVLKDTSKTRIESRIQKLDTLVILFKHFVDSVGIDNLGAAPSRFYKTNETFYKPFVKQLKNEAANSFAYFNKNDPNNPLGYIWFDDKSNKIISWILIDQEYPHK